MKILNIFYAIKTSLQKRFILSISFMLLPMIILALSGYLLLKDVIVGFEAVKVEALEELYPVMRLQVLLQKAAMPPNDYLINGQIEERESFARFCREIDKEFAAVPELPFNLEEEKTLIGIVKEKWAKAKSIGDYLLSIERPVGNPSAALEMQRFDKSIDEIDDIFDKFYGVVNREIHDELAAIHSAKQRALFLISAILVVSSLLAATVGIALARSVLVPLHELEEGTRRFASGELSSRVNVAAKNELGHLAKTFNDMAEQIERNEKELEELSIHDGLTGLFNKLEFTRRLRDEVARAKRYNGVFSLIMMDIDHFKAVNDTYGHQAGDKVLRAVSALIKKEIRTMDFVARYGGEELVAVLPETPGAAAFHVAERMRKALAAHAIEISKEKTISVTISLGVADFPHDADAEEALVGAADQALYAAKNSGRNQAQRFALKT